MIIREASSTDIPEIVKTLKVSLGDDLPISEEIWYFKHVDNPFGPSIVLLAEEEGEIIGIRAFMRWKWQKNENIYETFRAVDTATHPQHRGKGIFKKLTLQCIDLAKNENGDFIFNTPNDQSRPGYLKMGWVKAGKLNVALKPSFTSFLKLKNKKKEMQENITASDEDINKLCYLWNRTAAEKGIFTPKSAKYLHWRFESNPLQDYSVHADPDFYIAVCFKKRKAFTELRVSELIYNNKQALKKAKQILRKWCSIYGVQFISFSPEIGKVFSLAVKGNFGPILTLRELNITGKQQERVFNLQNWAYSLGDLELF